MKKSITLIAILLFTIVLAACGKRNIDTNPTVIRVVATEDPHAKILRHIEPLLKEQGFTLELEVISSYPLGNPTVASGSADANFFQHVPYFNAHNSSAKENEQLSNVAGIHIEPIGLYGSKKTSLDDLADHDTIIISDNEPDYGRIVLFLKNIGLVTTADSFDPKNEIKHPDEAIVTKTKYFKFKVVQADFLARTKGTDGEFIFINGNYAISGNINPLTALKLEPTENNVYVNILAVLKGNKNHPKIKALVAALTSETAKKYITDTYTGSVIPAF